MSDFDGKVDAVRKQIVATTEGGAITGEERLREHTDQLYGAILSYEGKPADYQIARIDSLRRELADATKDFESLLDKRTAEAERPTEGQGQPAIEPPPAKVAVNDSEPRGGGGLLNGAFDPDLPAERECHSRQISACCVSRKSVSGSRPGIRAWPRKL